MAARTRGKVWRLIDVNANELRYQVMRVMRVGLAGSHVATAADRS